MRVFRPIAVVIALLLPTFAVPASSWADVNGNPNVSTFVPVAWNPFTGVQIHNVFWVPSGGWDANNRSFLSEASVNTATAALARSDYFDGVAQYGGPHRTFAGGLDTLGICGAAAGLADASRLDQLVRCEAGIPLSGVVSGELQPFTNIYNVFVPDAVAADNHGCHDWHGMHILTVDLVFYAIIPTQCANNLNDLTSIIGHEDVEMISDPVIGVGWFDHNIAGPVAGSIVDLVQHLASDFSGTVAAILKFFNAEAEIGDLCGGGSPYPAPPDFQSVPATLSNIPMALASYWSNSAHACVVGGDHKRVVEATFNAPGLPSDTSGVVNGPNISVNQSGVVTEQAVYAFPSPITAPDGTRFFPSSGDCAGTVSFPAQSTLPITQVRQLTCTYSTTPGLPGTGVPPDFPPVVSAGPDVTGDETTPIQLYGAAADPEGEGVSLTWTAVPAAGTDPGAGCTFADPHDPRTTIICSDEGTYTLTLTGSDGVNAPVASSTAAHVNNLGPSIGITAPAPWRAFRAGTPIQLTAPITDPGAHDSHTCTANWDDGTVDSYAPTGAGCDHSHVFTHAGMYTIKVTVTDDDGQSDSRTVLVIAYDPDAGAVFGNGWLDKPGGTAFDISGSYPSSTASVPQGAVTFSVSQPPLALRTNNQLDWVVITPDGKFAIKGTAELVPGRTVGFVLYGYTAPDQLRMVIWDATAADNPDGAAALYDNRPGASFDLDQADPEPVAAGTLIISHPPQG